MSVNLKGVFLCCQAVIPTMQKNHKGKIINMSSKSARVGDPVMSAYCASKGGVSSLTTQLAVELAPWHINVNAIAPGFIDTPLNSSLLKDPGRVKSIIEATPVGRIGTSEK